MLKKIATILIALIMIVIGSALLASGQEVVTATYDIKITTNENDISVIENIKVDTASVENLKFWIQNGATDIEFLIDDISVEYKQDVVENIYNFNVSGLVISTDTPITQFVLLPYFIGIFVV